MTLGGLIKILGKEDKNKTICSGFNDPHSYRGDYSCVAFEPTGDMKIGEILKQAKDALNSEYQGWKGGEYVMDENTDVYIANEGDCGISLTSFLLYFVLGKDMYENFQGWGDIFKLNREYDDIYS